MSRYQSRNRLLIIRELLTVLVFLLANYMMATDAFLQSKTPGLLLTALKTVRLGVDPFIWRKYSQSCHTLNMQDSSSGKKKVVFLGTPEVAAKSLEILLGASKEGRGGGFEICAVVTQPPALAGRNKKLTFSPVHFLAEKHQLKVFTPEQAKDNNFIEELTGISPDLCITAAYGQFLPGKFLRIPRFGTLNIHPSLLPKYRGASPVQRALEAGDKVVGVSVLFTVLKMDAGPVVRQREYTCTGDEKAPYLLEKLFEIGTNELLESLPSVWNGTCEKIEQDETLVVAADKISKNEGIIDFSRMGAVEIHNRGRAFAGWPGIQADFFIGASAEQASIKIITTRVIQKEPGSRTPSTSIEFKDNMLEVVCGDGSVLGIVELQPPTKKCIPAKDFWNGLRKNSLTWWKVH